MEREKYCARCMVTLNGKSTVHEYGNAEQEVYSASYVVTLYGNAKRKVYGARCSVTLNAKCTVHEIW